MLLLIALVVESPPFYHKQPLGTHTLITYMPVFWTRSVYCIMFEPAHPSVLVCNPTRYILKNEMTWTQSHGCNRLWMVLVLPMKLKKPKVQKNFPYSTQKPTWWLHYLKPWRNQPFHLPTQWQYSQVSPLRQPKAELKNTHGLHLRFMWSLPVEDGLPLRFFSHGINHC